MKYNASLKVLEIISDGIVMSADLFAAIATSGYGASVDTLGNAVHQRQLRRDTRKYEQDKEKQAKQRYYNLLYKLKRDGLVVEKVTNGSKYYQLTQKGKEKLTKLKRNEGYPNPAYQCGKGNTFVIVTFDIPEKDRKKRAWLRAALAYMSCSMVQHSVWVGKVKLPQEFIDDLFRLGLEEFVEIFEVGKTGSLKHIV